MYPSDPLHVDGDTESMLFADVVGWSLMAALNAVVERSCPGPAATYETADRPLALILETLAARRPRRCRRSNGTLTTHYLRLCSAGVRTVPAPAVG